jgi:hypothetical protein
MTVEPVDPLPRFYDAPVTFPPPLEFINSISFRYVRAVKQHIYNMARK